MIRSIKSWLVNGSVVTLTALAVILAISKARHFRADGEAGARVWFYDQGARQLYAAPRDLIPPDGNDDAKVLAVVIGFQGMGNDSKQLRIAYLEKYSPDLKALLERAVAAHAARLPFKERIPAQGTPEFDENKFVKNPDEPTWHAAGSEEARSLMAGWREWRGPSGQVPIISVPAIRQP